MDAKSMVNRSEAGARKAADEQARKAEAVRIRREKEEAYALEHARTVIYPKVMRDIAAAADRGERSISAGFSDFGLGSTYAVEARYIEKKLRDAGYKTRLTGWSTETHNMGDSAAPCAIDIRSVYLDIQW